jgi:hypothetical protein
MNSFRSIIELWPSRAALAAELGATPAQVSKWWQRKIIPAEWWAAIIASSRAAEAGVNAELLTSLAARETADTAEAAE